MPAVYLLKDCRNISFSGSDERISLSNSRFATLFMGVAEPKGGSSKLNDSPAKGFCGVFCTWTITANKWEWDKILSRWLYLETGPAFYAVHAQRSIIKITRFINDVRSYSKFLGIDAGSGTCLEGVLVRELPSPTVSELPTRYLSIYTTLTTITQPTNAAMAFGLRIPSALSQRTTIF